MNTPSPTGNLTMRQGAGGNEIAFTGDLQATAIAASAKAEIEARITLALMRPRDYDTARRKILDDAERPSTAAIALYNKPVGKERDGTPKYITDFSIRFMEAALQKWGNTHTTSRVIYDDAEKMILQVGIVDLETNSSYSQDAVIQKTVERRSTHGRDVKAMRENSSGQSVAIVYATEDEVRNKAGAERSKLIRDMARRIIPRELLEEAREKVDLVMAQEHAKDPEAAKKKVLDRFASVGVMPTALKEYLGKPLEALTKADVAELHVLFNGLKEGDIQWTDVMKLKAPESDQPEAGTAELREAIGLAREKAAAAGQSGEKASQ